MNDTKLRRRIADEAARLLFLKVETDYVRARMLAARRVCGGVVTAGQLPAPREIRERLQELVRVDAGRQQNGELRPMRLAALRIMKCLLAFRPRLLGKALSGRPGDGAEIRIHVFADGVADVAAALAGGGLAYRLEHVPEARRRQGRPIARTKLVPHLRVDEAIPADVAIYAPRYAERVFRHRQTGKPVERIGVAQLEELLEPETTRPDDLIADVGASGERVADELTEDERFRLFESLLLPLERVRQHPAHHPEGDALYHSLQVFALAREALAYDEEFLLAALLHDVGKGIDPHDPVAAALEALDGAITSRTAWFIENLPVAKRYRDGSLGQRARMRLREEADFDELILLEECDRRGRQQGAVVPDVEEALEYIRAGAF